MRRAVGLVLVAVVAVAALVLLRAPGGEQPVAVVGHRGLPPQPSSTTVPAMTASTPTTTAKPTVVVANRSRTVVRSDAGGVTVVNEGSAVAGTGGNTVIGPPHASVSNGPVSAVGNSAEVRVSRR